MVATEFMKSKIISHYKHWIMEKDLAVVAATLESKMISKGFLVEKFEKIIQEKFNFASAFATTSGTAAIIVALKTLRIKANDEVILPTYACKDLEIAIRAVGASPIFSDVLNNGTLGEKNIEKLISSNTKAIIAVHTFGHYCDIDKLKNFKIPIIEDACHSFGAIYFGRNAGSIGDIGIFSFNATKGITTGEGGMVVINRSEYEADLKALMEMHTYFFRISDLQASLGISQIMRMHEFQKKQRKLEMIYLETLNDIKNVKIMDPLTPFRSRFAALVPDVETIQSKFATRGIKLKRGVDALLHRTNGLRDDNFPTAVKLYGSVISIPFYPALSEQEIEYIRTTMVSQLNDL